MSPTILGNHAIPCMFKEKSVTGGNAIVLLLVNEVMSYSF